MNIVLLCPGSGGNGGLQPRLLACTELPHPLTLSRTHICTHSKEKFKSKVLPKWIPAILRVRVCSNCRGRSPAAPHLALPHSTGSPCSYKPRQIDGAQPSAAGSLTVVLGTLLITNLRVNRSFKQGFAESPSVPGMGRAQGHQLPPAATTTEGRPEV